MYLLLVENNFISSREIKAMLDKHNINCEIVNSSSSDSLLDIAEKLAPEIVIIDFDFYIDDSAEIVRRLRQYSNEAYILAFIDPDHYEKLHKAIEVGIDDYMVKPLQRDDVMLRIKMGLQRKSNLSTQPAEEVKDGIEKAAMLSDLEEVFYREDKTSEVSTVVSEEMELKTEQTGEKNFTDAQTYYDLSYESPEPEPAEDDLETLSNPAASFLDVQGSDEADEEDSGITVDEYDDLEELFGIQPEKGQDQTNTINLREDLDIQNESSAADEYDLQDMPVAEPAIEQEHQEPTASKNDNNYEIAEEKRSEDYGLEPLADFFSEWPDLADPEDSVEEFTEELTASHLEEPEPKPEPEPEPELEPKSELEWERELEHEPELESAMETEIEPELEPELELEMVLENDPYLSEEISDVTEDKELFGMTNGHKNTDKNTFEDIFTRKNEFEEKKSKFSQNDKSADSKTGQNNSFFFEKKNRESTNSDASNKTLKAGLTIDQNDADPSKEAKNSSFAKIAGILTISVFLLLVTLSIILIQNSGIGGG